MELIKLFKTKTGLSLRLSPRSVSEREASSNNTIKKCVMAPVSAGSVSAILLPLVNEQQPDADFLLGLDAANQLLIGSRYNSKKKKRWIAADGNPTVFDKSSKK